ncbi:MAG: hypothetical protein ACK4N5_26295, partial [Myxococcales bacterium]
MPTERLAWALLLVTLPATAAIAWPPIALLCGGADVALLLAFLCDAALARRARAVVSTRVLAGATVVGRRTRLDLRLVSRSDAPLALAVR